MQYSTLNEILAMNESSLSRIHQKSQDIAGTITAYRGDFTKRENQQRNRSLLAKLMTAGYSVTSVKGSYIENYGSNEEKEVSEHSYFISPRTDAQRDSLVGDLLRLGAEFDQDSVLIIRDGKGTLIGTSRRDNAWPEFGKSEPVGGFKGGKAAEFLSRVGNRPYVFEEVEYPRTINGIRGLMALAKKDWRDIDV